MCRGTEIKVTGEEEAVDGASRAISAMLELWRSKAVLDEHALDYCISLARSGDETRVSELTGDFILLTAKGRPVRPQDVGTKGLH